MVCYRNLEIIYRPKWLWADFDMGRFGHGPKWPGTHVIVFRQEKSRTFCQIKDAITQWPNCCLECDLSGNHVVRSTLRKLLKVFQLFFCTHYFDNYHFFTNSPFYWKTSLFPSIDNLGYDGPMKISQFWDKMTLFFPILSAPVPVPKSRKKITEQCVQSKQQTTDVWNESRKNTICRKGII